MLDLEAPRGVESATLPVRPRTPERNDVIHATLEVPLLDAASPNILRSLAARLGAPFARSRQVPRCSLSAASRQIAQGDGHAFAERPHNSRDISVATLPLAS